MTLSDAFRGLSRFGFWTLGPRLNWQACLRVSYDNHLTCHIIIIDCTLRRCHEWLLFLSFPLFLVLREISSVDVRTSPRSKTEINTINDNDEYLSNCIKTSARYPKSITLVSTGKGKHSPTTSYTFKVFQFSLCIAYGSKVLLSIDRVDGVVTWKTKFFLPWTWPKPRSNLGSSKI